MVALLLLSSLPFIISQGLQHRLNLGLPGFTRARGQMCVWECVWCLRALVTPFSHLWNGIMSPDELVKGSAVRLSLTPHLACSSRPVPLLASPHAGHNRNSLAPSSSPLHSTRTSPNSMPLMTLLYEHQMLPNDLLNCRSGTLDDIRGPF